MAESHATPEDLSDEVERSRMTLAEHLDELRKRAIRATIAVTVALVALWTFRASVTQWITRPYEQAIGWLNSDLVEIQRDRLAADPELDATRIFEGGDVEAGRLRPEVALSPDLNLLGIGSGFFFQLRVCFWLALFIGGPVVLWEIWRFVAAGLYRSERSVVYSYFPASLALFVGGVLFGYFLMVPYAIYFLEKDQLGRPGFTVTTSSDNYLQFLKGLALAMGAVFQLPIFQLALARLGIVDPRSYAKYRPHMIVGTLVLAALITPPDPITQMMMAGPAIVLYEVGAWIARLAWRPPPTLEDAGAA